MKRSRWMVLAVLAGMGWTGFASAQIPAGGAAGAAAAGAGAAGEVKLGFFEKVCAKIDKCRRKLCASPAGAMLNTMTKPASQMTGGIIPSFCPAMPTKEEQQEAGAKGAAAQGKADAADAKARVAAVQYLGTLDCHWHPEAEAGLVKALRTDRNECVRLAAAVALNRGCCCTKAILEALIDCVNGKELLGPYENSPRVQNVALIALEKCVSCNHEPADAVDTTDPGTKKEKDTKKEGTTAPAGPADAKPMSTTPAVILPPTPVTRYSGPPTVEQIERGKLVAAHARSRGPIDANEGATFANGQRDLYHLYRYIIAGKTATTSVATTAPMMANSAPVTMQTGPVMARTPSAPSVTQMPMGTRPALTPSQLPASLSPISSAPAATRGTPAPTVMPGDMRTSATPAARLAAPRTIDPKVLRCLETLRDANDAEVRHAAVKTLVTINWQENPEVLMALIHAARTDKHAGMRVACIRSLGSMKACTPEVMTGLKPLTADADEWIRTETMQALTYLQSFMSSRK